MELLPSVTCSNSSSYSHKYRTLRFSYAKIYGSDYRSDVTSKNNIRAIFDPYFVIAGREREERKREILDRLEELSLFSSRESLNTIRARYIYIYMFTRLNTLWLKNIVETIILAIMSFINGIDDPLFR